MSMRRIVPAVLCVLSFAVFGQAEVSWLERSKQIMDESKRQETPTWLMPVPKQNVMDEAERLFGSDLKRQQQILERAGTGVAPASGSVDAKAMEAVSGSATVSGPAGDSENDLQAMVKRLRALRDGEADALAAEGEVGKGAYNYRDQSVRQIFILVSMSMPREELIAAAQEAADHHIPLVFRGVDAKARSINRHGLMVKKLIEGKVDGKVQAVIDFRPFKDTGTTLVPSIVVMQEGRYVVARGSLSVSFVQQAFDDQKQGDLGRFGRVFEIAEKELLADMQERAEKVDWEGLKSGAVQRFVDNLNFVELPNAKETKTRMFDPSVVLSYDVNLPDGRILAKEGTRINPLKYSPFRKKMIVFDGTNPKHLAFVAKEIKLAGDTQPLILITNRFEKTRELDGFQKIYNRLDRHIYLLQEDVASRFALTALPTTIVQKGDFLQITEHAIEGGK